MISPDRFRAIMACAPGPATVVTAMSASGRPQGLTVSAVCSVSLNPPLALACLDLKSNTLAAVRESGAFTVNYLAHGFEDVALSFAVKSDNKFDGQRWIAPRGGIGGPILADVSAAYAVCRVEQMVEAGDHVILVGEVIDGEARKEGDALVYARRRFFTGKTVSA